MTTTTTAKAPNQAGTIQKAAAHNAVKAGGQPTTIKGWLKAYTTEIARALPAQIGPDRFNRICMTALTANPKLGECTPASFIGAVMNAAQLGLEPNTPLGQAYLIPFRNKGKMEVQFQIGFKGLIQLARRSGEISMIQAQTVYDNDEFTYELGLDPVLKHVPAKGDRGKSIAYYAFYKTRSGDYAFEVAYKPEMEQFARTYSQAYSKGYSSPWKTNFDEMAKKTLLKRVLKYAPMSTEIAMQVQSDSTIKHYDPNADQDTMKDLTLAHDETEYIEAEYEETPEQEQDDLDTRTDPVTGEVRE